MSRTPGGKPRLLRVEWARLAQGAPLTRPISLLPRLMPSPSQSARLPDEPAAAPSSPSSMPPLLPSMPAPTCPHASENQRSLHLAPPLSCRPILWCCRSISSAALPDPRVGEPAETTQSSPYFGTFRIFALITCCRRGELRGGRRVLVCVCSCIPSKTYPKPRQNGAAPPVPHG